MEIDNEIGMPIYFNLDLYLQACEELIKSDEIKSALYMLENMPGYYRDNIPEEVLNLKRDIYARIMTLNEYIETFSETKSASEEIFKGVPIEDHCFLKHYQPRSECMFKLVIELNEKNIVPHITELAPGNFWLPYGLRKYGKKFKYKSISINKNALLQAKDKLADVWSEHVVDDATTIFCCFETIEHLWYEDEIYHYYAKHGIDADYIMLSTPMYTLDGGHEDWRNKELAHIRTYTPEEFLNYGVKHWPEHKWNLVEGHMMVIEGKK